MFVRSQSHGRNLHSMAMTNLRERLSGGTTAFGGWCTMGSSFGAELLGSSGFDYVCVDLQHGLSDFELGWQLVQALRGTGASPIVRVPFNHTPWPGKAFDAGAEAVVVPMVNSRADAEAAVAACRYAPEGVRSFGPVRSGLLLGDDPVAVNRSVLCLVMIESVHAVEAADAICSTPGVDGIYIGPADLSVSMCGSLAAMGSTEHAGSDRDGSAGLRAQRHRGGHPHGRWGPGARVRRRGLRDVHDRDRCRAVAERRACRARDRTRRGCESGRRAVACRPLRLSGERHAAARGGARLCRPTWWRPRAPDRRVAARRPRALPAPSAAGSDRWAWPRARSRRAGSLARRRNRPARGMRSP